jgi:hypothetical protein
MSNQEYVPLAAREFARLKKLADRAIAQLPADRLFEVPGEGDNSVAVIIKHVGGNLCSRWRDFLTADGEKPDRRRDDEFVIVTGDSREALLARWEEGWSMLFASLAPLGDADLGRTVTIRGEPLTVLLAINRQLTHNAYHVGQIVYLAKHYSGSGWRSLSIPRGESERFNRAPQRYGP